VTGSCEAAVSGRAKDGLPLDPRAFAALVHPHLPRLYRYAARLCRHPEQAADLAQDALVKAFERQDRYDPARPILPWLLTLVRNACIDRVRSFDPIREAARRGDLDVTGVPGSSDPGDAAVAAERATVVEAALARVPVDQRSCLVLYHVEGLTLDEIADAEGVPVGTVKSRLFRGRQALADALGDRARDL
jgi:RNA polymerase sigma-70 factor (ECF subfamily)